MAPQQKPLIEEYYRAVHDNQESSYIAMMTDGGHSLSHKAFEQLRRKLIETDEIQIRCENGMRRLLKPLGISEESVADAERKYADAGIGIPHSMANTLFSPSGPGGQNPYRVLRGRRLCR